MRRFRAVRGGAAARVGDIVRARGAVRAVVDAVRSVVVLLLMASEQLRVREAARVSGEVLLRNGSSPRSRPCSCSSSW